jgi:hypothetical protein
MGVLSLFGIGRKEPVTAAKVAEVKVEEQSIRKKFLEAFEDYTTAYNMSRRTIGYSISDEKRKNFLASLYAKLPNFAHKDLVEHVFNSPGHFSNTSKMFEQMEQCLKQPTNTNFTRFERAKNADKNAIDTNFMLAGRVSRYLLKNDAFDKAVYDINHTSIPLNMIAWYYKLSQLEMEYFKHICDLRDNTVARAAVSASAVPSKS